MTEAGQVVSAKHSLPQMLKLHEQLIAITYTFQEPNHAMGAKKVRTDGMERRNGKSGGFLQSRQGRVIQYF